jgi:hypothetical protein
VKIENIFLFLAAAGLVPIALSYGLLPAYSLDAMFDISINNIESAHIFRAVMGLYLLTASYWVFGALNSKHTINAMRNLTIFMLGLALGRILSIMIDGNPNMILWLYLLLELGFGIVGLILLRKNSQIK